MPIFPDNEQISVLTAGDLSQPVAMVNLLKFKDRASYEDGRDTDLSGEQAYQIYGEAMKKLVAAHGGRHLFVGRAEQLLIGEGALEWDWVAIVEYPSRQTFFKISQTPDYEAIRPHRLAGLDHQLLIPTNHIWPPADGALQDIKEG